MAPTSHSMALNERLLTVEGYLLQRQFEEFRKELARLDEADYSDSRPDHGLYISLCADRELLDANYRSALKAALKATSLLADYPFNSHYARALLVVSKAYFSLGDLKNAEIRARDALAAYRRAGDKSGQVESLNNIARTAYTRCDYQVAGSLVKEAIDLAADYPDQVAKLTGNAGAICVLTGQWDQAEQYIERALSYYRFTNDRKSVAVNLLSRASLHIRKREFVLAGRALDEALTLIDEIGLKREKIIYLEFAGQLALEKGDTTRARHILSDACHQGKLIAPESALVSQSLRLLAETELALDNADEAMKCAQKSLELSLRLGELSETGVTRTIIARVFSLRKQHADALEYIENAVETLRSAGDLYLLGRAQLVYGEILAQADAENVTASIDRFSEAVQINRSLGLSYALAESLHLKGIAAC